MDFLAFHNYFGLTVHYNTNYLSTTILSSNSLQICVFWLIANHQVANVHAIKKWALRWLIYIREDVEYKTLVVPYHVREYWSLFIVEQDEMFHFDNLPNLHTKRAVVMHMRRIKQTMLLLRGWDPSDPRFSHYMDKTTHSVPCVPQTNNWECGYACICNLELRRLHWQQAFWWVMHCNISLHASLHGLILFRFSKFSPRLSY